MSEESALLQAVASGDDIARLALADLWEERGDPRSAWAREPRILAWMLPDGRDPLPALLEELDEEGSRSDEAIQVLSLLGEIAVPALMERVETGERWAGQALGGMPSEYVGDVVDRLIQLVSEEDPDQSLAAVYALRAAGPAAAPAVPLLSARLESLLVEDEGELYIEDGEEANVLAEVLGNVGPAARPAVPILVRALSECYEVNAALVGIGPEGVPDLLHAVTELPVEYYIVAADPLGRLAPDALPYLRDGLKHTSQQVRGVAALALAPHSPEEAMPILVESLAFRLGQDTSDDCRYVDAILEASAFAPLPAAELRPILPDLSEDAGRKLVACLEKLEGPDGMLALLRERLVDPDPDRRARAVATLGVLSVVPDEAVVAVLTLLEDKHPWPRDQARQMLHRVARAGRSHLIGPVLPGCLQHQDEEVVLWAMEELAYMKDEQSRALLRSMLQARKEPIRNRAVELLRGPSSTDIVPELLRMATKRANSSRAIAVEALGETGPLTDTVRDAIHAGMQDRAAEVRVAALRAASLRGVDAIGVVDLVTSIPTTSANRGERQVATETITWCGLPASETGALLFDLLGSSHQEVRSAATHQLAYLAETDPIAASVATPRLLEALRSPETNNSKAAAWALSRMGGTPMPGLIDVLREATDRGVSYWASQAFEFMEEAAAPATEVLLETLATDDLVTRERAAWALAHIAPVGIDTTPVRQLLRLQRADTVEYAITILVRIGATAAWPEIAPLVEFAWGGDVAAATVWASRHLLPQEEARTLWRRWVDSHDEAVQRAAHYELWRIGEAEPLPAEQLLAAAYVFALREEIATLLAERARSEPQVFRTLLQATGWGHHGYHGTASMALFQLVDVRSVEVAEALFNTLDYCAEVAFRRRIVATLANLPTAVLISILPRLRELWRKDEGLLRGAALAIHRSVITETLREESA